MALTGGTGLTPYAKKSVLSTNYIDFTSADANSANWAQQYIPEVYEAEVDNTDFFAKGVKPDPPDNAIIKCFNV